MTEFVALAVTWVLLVGLALLLMALWWPKTRSNAHPGRLLWRAFIVTRWWRR